MARKYRLNPKTIQVEYEKNPLLNFFRKGMVLVFASAVLGVSFLHIQDKKLDTPGVMKLLDERNEIEFKLSLIEKEIHRMENEIREIQLNDDNLYRTFFEVSPLSATLRDAGFGGNTNNDFFNAYEHKEVLAGLNRDLDKLSKKLVVQSRSFDDVIDLALTKEKRMAARPVIQPISINDLTRFGSSFGMRMHPILKIRRMHEGIDLTAARGTPVFATADGVVLQAGYTTGGYGNKILIDHGFGYRTLYGHCHKIKVEKGQKVKRGDIIATVGSTGLSISPHLHYEVHVNGRAVNPIYYYANDLSADEFDHMIDLLSKADPSFDIN